MDADAATVLGALSATGGTVTAVTAEEGAEDERFEVTVEPSGSGDVTVELSASTDCAAEGSVCTSGDVGLEEDVRATVAFAGTVTVAVAGVPQVGQVLTASVDPAPGGSATWQWLRGGEEIAEATAAAYTPVAADVGAELAARVTQGGTAVTSPATAPVWPAPANPPLATGEEELLSAVVTLEAWNGYPLTLAGYGRLPRGDFGEINRTVFEDGGTEHALSLVAINWRGTAVLSTGAPLPDAEGLVAYWNGHRISGLTASTGSGVAMLSAKTPQPRDDYMRYMEGAADGVRVAVSLRRTTAVVHVTSAAVTSAPGDNGAWDEDETVEAEVRFSAPVTVSGGPPTLAVMLDATRREAAYTGGSGTDTLTFALTVSEDDAGAKRARVASNGLKLHGATLGAGDGVRVDTSFAVAPWVTRVAIAPDASGDREWTPGETIEARLTFSEAVTVTDGEPWLEVNIGEGGLPLFIAYASGSGTHTLVFSTECRTGAGALTELCGGRGQPDRERPRRSPRRATRMAADLRHDATEPTAPPGEGPAEPLTATLREVPQTHDGSAFTFGIAFSEDVALTSAMLSATNGEVSGTSQTTPGSDRTWDVTVTPDGGGDVTVTIPVRACGEANAACTADGRGLEADVSAMVSAQVPGEEPFTVSVSGVPEEHDGESPFLFEVTLNKDVDDYSYKTMKDETIVLEQGRTSVHRDEGTAAQQACERSVGDHRHPERQGRRHHRHRTVRIVRRHGRNLHRRGRGAVEQGVGDGARPARAQRRRRDASTRRRGPRSTSS